MADGVNPRLLTTTLTGRGVPEAPGTTNMRPSTSATTSRRVIFVACGIPLSLVVAAAMVFAVVYVHERRRNRKQASDTGFCCPDEAREIAVYVNRSVSPCQDFFAYACSSAISDALSLEATVRAQLSEAMITGVMPGNVAMREAGRFLNAYYQTCVHAILKHESFASSLASAVLRHTTGLLSKADSLSAMTFIVAVSLRYYLPSVISIKYRGVASLYLGRSLICPIDNRSLDDLVTTVQAINGNTNMSAPLKQVIRMTARLCHKFRGKVLSSSYDVRNNSSAFNHEVWNIEDLRAAVETYGFTLDDVDVIDVEGARTIRHLYELFTDDAHPSSKAAYLLWHTVVSGLRAFDVETGTVSSRVFEICSNSIIKLSGLWGLFQAELLTSDEKDVQARTIFAAIRDTAYEQFKSSPFFETEDVDELKRFLKNVNLLLPLFMSKASIPVPSATPDFAQNLLNGRAYNLELRRARLSILAADRMLSYREVKIVEDRYLLLLPNMYNFIRTGSSTSKLPNMAVLGQLLAESLWVMAFYNINWKPRTQVNIEKFMDCFVKTYLKDVMYDADAENTIYSALGLSTVLGALNSTEWHTVKIAWSLWRLSDAQFLYVLNSYHRCPKSSSTAARAQINVPLMYNEDFAKAYKCSSDSPMVQTHQCLLHGASAT
ncbi:hypothetical protein HPB49_014764 [Dermacentor silvarum]|uniref:Uncharacterized protein n=1 Tax=Dermacentor silvarum TaxID=543639 RepID=A0ACB8D6D6_DERSI|nr:hypothetical protein HPB49_014764 [Dermacentor silvarum]